jgi:transposase
MSKERRRFTREFKVEAVRLLDSSGASIRGVARELGIEEGSLRRWRQRLKEEGDGAFPDHGKARKLIRDEELERLRKEVSRLRQERDILKKAVAYFANQS